MNSLQDLNGYGQTSITITDDRFATVIFNRMPPLQALDKEQKITTTTVAVTPTIEITDIINYSTANVRYRVQIRSKDNLLTATSLSWPTLPGYMSVGTVGLVYTVTGFRTASDWNTARAFTWTLPADFATAYPKFWLDIKIIYFDEELGVDVEKDWAFYDLKFYEVAALQAVASMNTIPNHYKTTECDLQSAFTLFGAGGEEIQLIPTNLSASSSITINASKTIIESASAALNSSFTQTTVNSRRRGGVVALNTTCTVSASSTRVRRNISALNSAFTQTAALTPAPFTYSIRGLGSYGFNVIGTDLVIDLGNGLVLTEFDALTETTVNGSYPSGAAEYTITIKGNLTSIRLGNTGSALFRILGVSIFNPGLQSFSMLHTGTGSGPNENVFTYVPNQIPRSLTNLNYAFKQCSIFNQDISGWDTSNVTNMRDMFSVVGDGTYIAEVFNQPLNNWDTSNVTDMQNMFRGQRVFNQPLNNWDTGSVTNMTRMFGDARAFNQNINTWDTSNVTNMNSMFFDARAFNQPLNNWDTSNVTDMQNMFRTALVYDQDISAWCVELIASKPTDFDTGTPASWITAEKPNWGAPC
jgi:surface protein